MQRQLLAEALEDDLKRFAQLNQARWLALRDLRDLMLAMLQREASALWPEAQCALFGSCAVGLATTGSDIDVVVLHVPADVKHSARQHQAACAKQLAHQLGGLPWVRSITTIDQSATPIVSLVCAEPELAGPAKEPPAAAPTAAAPPLTAGAPATAPLTSSRPLRAHRRDPPELSLDVSFHTPGHHGLEAMQLMAEQCVELPMLAPLVLLLSSFLEQHQAGEVYHEVLPTTLGIPQARLCRPREARGARSGRGLRLR